MHSHITNTSKTSQNSNLPTTASILQPRGFGIDTPQPETTTQERDLDAEYEYAKKMSRYRAEIPILPPNLPPNIQAKLSIGQPNDKYEQEADNVATKVVNKINTPSNTENPIHAYPLIQPPYINTHKEYERPPLQRVENLAPLPQRNNRDNYVLHHQLRENLRRKEAEQQSKISTNNQELENTIQSKKGSGQQIAADVREPMEQAFGADFSGVRVHTDGESNQLNQSLNAKAFATGQDVFFRQGAYNPTSRDGQHLLAHELTHVVQQNGNLGTVKPNSFKQKEFEKNPTKPEQEHSNKEKTSTSKVLEESQNQEIKPKKKNDVYTEGNHQSEIKPGKDITNPAKIAGNKQNTEPLIPQGKQPSTIPPTSPPTPENPEPMNLGETKEETPTQTATSASLNSAPNESGGSADVGNVKAPEVEANVSEESEAATMQQQMQAAQPENDTDESGKLSESEKTVAMAALAESSAPAVPLPSGGGGGGAITEKPTPPVPDVSQSEPSAGLAAISNLPPAQILTALGGVNSAVSQTVGKQKAELAANPPEMETSFGENTPASAKEVPPGEKTKPVEKAPEKAAIPVPPPQPLPPQTAPKVTATPPVMKGNEEGKLSEGDVEKMKASLNQLPTKDPGAASVSAGQAPPLALEGNANPQEAQAQRSKLEASVTEAKTQGQKEIAQPMGEQEIAPTIPTETLRAEIGGGSGGDAAPGGAVAAGGVPGMGEEGDGISILAQQLKGAEIQGAISQAQGDIATQKQGHAAKVEEEKAKSNQEIQKLKQDSQNQQAEHKSKALAEVEKTRGQWTKEENALIEKSGTDADQLISKGMKDVEVEKTNAETKASEEIKKGDEKAAEERRKGEENAAAEQAKGKQESSGIFGWLADKAKAFFEGIKQAVEKAFEAARNAIKTAIDTAKKLATDAIELGRKAIVGIIKTVGDGLIALGDKLLAAFPEVREKFRNTIKTLVKAAEDTVNKIAEGLKTGIKAALDLLGKGLDLALGLLEKGMKAAISLVETAVNAAIKFAEAAVKAVGAFAVLVKDIAANPGQWLSNLGAAIKDGIQNHLWGAFQEQTQTWFTGKLESILGVPLDMIQMIIQGGISLAEIGKMAWNGIKEAIPGILIGILVEKLVSMLVPAAGMILTVIEGLQAAWGTASQILQAFERFIAFLKAIKSGTAGPAFGSLLASAAVTVIDFVSNWLIKKLVSAAKKVAGKIKGIAQGLKDKFSKKGNKNKDKDKKGSKDKKGNKDQKDKDDKNDKNDKDNKADKQKRLKQAMNKAGSLLNIHADNPDAIHSALPQIKSQYKLVSLKLTVNNDKLMIEGEINPKAKKEKKLPKVDLSSLHGWRPSWRKSTDDTLRKQSPNSFIKIGDKYKKKSELDRRHIVSFEAIFKDLRSRVENKTYIEARNILGSISPKYKPAKANKAAIISSAKSYLRDKFNDPKNVWIGDAKENQELGQKLGQKLRELEKLQNELKSMKGQAKSERDKITAKIKATVDEIDKLRLDLPKHGKIKAAKDFLLILERQSQRDLGAI